MAKLGMPMVGVDPALVLCYRDEYKLALGEERGEFNVLLANEWLGLPRSHSQWLQSAVNHGISWSLYRSYRLAGCASTMGRDILPVLARNWKMSAWVAAAWQGLTDMQREKPRKFARDL